MHKTIKRFGMEGTVGDDSALIRMREQFERMILQEMRDKGYVPVLDLGPYWSTSWKQDKDVYEFTLSVYGVHVGEERACQVEGISDGREMPRHTPRSKSNQSSVPAE